MLIEANEAATEVTGGVGWRRGREDDGAAEGAAAAALGGCGALASLASTQQQTEEPQKQQKMKTRQIQVLEEVRKSYSTSGIQTLCQKE